jgi:hypothetical protein
VLKDSKIRRRPVAVRLSRIRRDPLPVAPVKKAVNAYPTEREVWVVVIGVIVFALALSALMFGISDVTAK